MARHIVDALVGGQPVRTPFVFSGAEAYLFTFSEADCANPVEVEIFEDWSDEGAGECLLGSDVGSTSTKAVLMTLTSAVAAGFYTRTAGEPHRRRSEPAGSQKSRQPAERRPSRFPAQPSLAPAASWPAGSSEQIWCWTRLRRMHGRPANSSPDVDTIIEIGGQDSKFTTLKDGRVNFCLMNTVCAAGAGSFIEEQA